MNGFTSKTSQTASSQNQAPWATDENARKSFCSRANVNTALPQEPQPSRSSRSSGQEPPPWPLASGPQQLRRGTFRRAPRIPSLLVRDLECKKKTQNQRRSSIQQCVHARSMVAVSREAIASLPTANSWRTLPHKNVTELSLQYGYEKHVIERRSQREPMLSNCVAKSPTRCAPE